MGRIVYSILGGDQRQSQCAKILAAKDNIVNIYGIECDFNDRNIRKVDILDRNFFRCHVLLLPIPYKNSEGHINHIKGIKNLKFNDFADIIHPSTKVILGKADSEIKNGSQKYGFEYFDLIDDETFSILNSIPSAEGAIQRAMERTDITIHGSKVLVLGYGRLGKTLSRMLSGIGANVTVAARKSEDLAWVRERGHKGIFLDKLDDILYKQDIVFNTIPALILDSTKLAMLSPESIIIDLASYPGGVDFDEAKRLGLRADLDLSLPGLVAPKAAGEIICVSIEHFIKDLGGDST
ncbi:MAG: dipicolinate synthase subunit DpsA [Clostridiales bacterium]|nr:dipicolinate synthase subunit DpsA [Clostridiales bacterium]